MHQDEDMSYEAEVLDAVLDSNDVPRKRLGAKMMVHKATLSKWLSGQTTVPVAALRAAFELTGDVRLLHLITGEIPCTFQISLDQQTGSRAQSRVHPAAKLVPLADLVQQACEATEQAARALKYVAKVVSDNRIDDNDARAIKQFEQHAAEAQRLLSLTVAALAAYQKRGVA